MDKLEKYLKAGPEFGHFPYLNYSLFPPPEYADKEGFLAISKDISPPKLLDAYTHGIFPWFREGELFCWFAPKKRAVLYLKDFKLHRSLRKTIRKNFYSVTCDQDFLGVITGCQEAYRKNQSGTWIDDGFLEGYVKFHQLGFAHSIEVWEDDRLVGGLYGVSLGKMFVGESMFSKKSDTSKIAFFYLSRFLESLGFNMIDAQIQNPHLISLGVIEIEREDYQDELNQALEYETLCGSWTEMFENWKKDTGVKL